MKPIHILSADATAGVIAEEIRRLGLTCTWGAEVSPAAKYVVTPAAPSGDAQADRLTAGDVLRGVRNARDDGRAYTCALFGVAVRGSASRQAAEAVAGTVPARSPVAAPAARTPAAAASTSDAPVDHTPHVARLWTTPPRQCVVATVLRTGGRYDARHVRWLLRQCVEYIRTPFRFVCLGDDLAVPGYVPLVHDWPRWWAKLELFRPGLFAPGEEILYLDLDTVLTRPFEVPSAPPFGHVAMVRFGGAWWTLLGSGAMLWRAGNERPYGAFRTRPAEWMRCYASDQEIVIASVMMGGGAVCDLGALAEVQKNRLDASWPVGVPQSPIYCAAGCNGKPWDIQREWIPLFPGPSPRPSDIALVTCFFGADGRRLAAAREGARQLSALPGAHTALLVEAVAEAGATRLSEWQGERLEIVLEPGWRQDRLWHKEALLEAGLRQVFAAVPKAVLCDLDTFPAESWRAEWLTWTSAALDRSPVVQPWCLVRDTEIAGDVFRSYAWNAAAGAGGIFGGQGFAQALTRDWWQAAGGLPTRSLSGSGDALMVQTWAEPMRHHPGMSEAWPHWRAGVAAYRGPHCTWGWLPCELVHASHGERGGRDGRHYHTRNWVAELAGGWEAVTEAAPNGLWRWRDTLEARAAHEMKGHLDEIADRASAERLWRDCLARQTAAGEVQP